jgi:hypothetical protein
MPYIQGETIREKLNRETQFASMKRLRSRAEWRDALDYRASARRDPSRHQAREHSAARRARDGDGLRHRTGRVCGAPAAA